MQTHLNVLVLYTDDLDTARQFYCGTLGLTLAEDNTGALVFGQSGGAELVVLPNSGQIHPADRPGLPLGSGVNPWFVVPDIGTYHAQVVAAGATNLTDPADGPFGRMFVVTSPDGHTLTFHQQRP
jgi:predicted enzyme related to lactoylglutathione lyase